MDELKLPEMPAPVDWVYSNGGSEQESTFTERQMRAYATQAERMGYLRGLEDAARVCERDVFDGWDAAHAIRELAKKAAIGEGVANG